MEVDLRSDTVTTPTAEMLDAMFNAKVGDDVFMEDPTVIELEKMCAKMFGMDGGIFCPSGTMTNQIAIKLHTKPGDEVICDRASHVYNYEGGGIAANSMASVRTIHGDKGRFTAQDIENNINNAEDVHLPLSSLVCVENTSNRGGGCCYDFEELKRMKTSCDQYGLKFHLDGARIFNAIVAKNENPADYGKLFDTISICLSKGLGTPVGSVLVGSQNDIKKARRIRKLFGGGMRQAGYLAAAGIYALNKNIDRLAIDHQRAKEIGEVLNQSEHVVEVFPVETNIIVAEVEDRDTYIEMLKIKGIKAIAFGPKLVRMVTHLSITDEKYEYLIQTLKSMN